MKTSRVAAVVRAQARNPSVIPAKAGIQTSAVCRYDGPGTREHWIPACAHCCPERLMRSGRKPLRRNNISMFGAMLDFDPALYEIGRKPAPVLAVLDTAFAEFASGAADAGNRVLRFGVKGVNTPSANSFDTQTNRNMFRISRYHKLMQSLPLGAFAAAVKHSGSDRHCKGFSSERHLRVMLFAQLSQAASLRELEDAFNSHPTHHYHLNCKAVRRTTLADANAKRDPSVFAAAAQALMQQCGRQLRQWRDQMLYLLDSTTISLDGRGFEWAAQQTTRNKGLKLHVAYDQQGGCPVYHSITSVNVNDLDEGKRLKLQHGATYVFDKGYCDYSWWWQFCQSDAVFVTRLKRNAALKVSQQRPIDPAHAQRVLRDEVCSFKYRSSRGGHRNAYEGQVRVVEVRREDKPETLVLVTNDLQRPAHEIAELYKKRWQIELFFKWIKQHLNVKRFLGRSENAVRIQLLVALIAFLLIKLREIKEQIKLPMNRQLNIVRSTLMQREDDGYESLRRRRAHQHDLASRQYSFI